MKRALLLLFLMITPVSAQNVGTVNQPVTMAVGDQEKMGVAVSVLVARKEMEGVSAIVRTIDPSALAALDAELATASAAAATSGAEFRRLEQLAAQDQSASQQAVEAARAQAAADVSRLTLSKRRIALEWGPAFASMPASTIAALISQIAGGEAALLRADAPQRPEGISGDVVIETNSAAGFILAQPIGLSGAVDPRMQTVGLYCIVRGEAAVGLRPGRVFAGEIRTSNVVTGVAIPASSIVVLDGANWAYIRTATEQFERREIVGPRVLSDGWFVTEGFSPRDAVVVRGAGSLLAVERADESVEAD